MNTEVQISRAPVIVNPVGNTSVERKLSIIESASKEVCFALAGMKGKVGDAARAGVAQEGMDGMIKKAAWPTCDYRPIAQFLAASLGEPIVISNRASFLALPDMFEQRLLKIKGSKSGGYRTNKDGMDVPTAAHELALRLKNGVTEFISEVEALSKTRKAEAEAKKAADAKLLAADPTMAQ